MNYGNTDNTFGLDPDLVLSVARYFRQILDDDDAHGELGRTWNISEIAEKLGEHPDRVRELIDELKRPKIARPLQYGGTPDHFNLWLHRAEDWMRSLGV